MISILLVDDEASFLEVTRMFLEKGRGIRVTTATSAEKALELLSLQKFDAIVSDYAMPGMNGIEFMKQVKAMDDETPFIIFTGKGREDVVIDALNFGASLYLRKGADPRNQFSDMVQKISGLVSYRHGNREERELCRSISAALEMIPGIAFRTWIDGKEEMICAGGGAVPLTGYEPGALSSDVPFMDLVHPDDRAGIQAARKEAFENRRRYRIRYRILTIAGAEKTVFEEGRPVPTEDGGACLEGYILDLGNLCTAPDAL